MNFSSFFLGGKPISGSDDDKPKTEESPVPEAASPPDPMDAIMASAKKHLGPNPHPEVLAAFMTASATLVVAQEASRLRQLFANGEATITVASP